MAPGRKLPHLLILCFYLQHFFLWLRPNFSSNEEKKIYCLSFLLMVESDFGVLPHVLTLYRREETGKLCEHQRMKQGQGQDGTCDLLEWVLQLLKRVQMPTAIGTLNAGSSQTVYTWRSPSRGVCR